MEIYRERAHLVAFLAQLFPSILTHADANEPEYAVIYIDSPSGQLSWHIHENDLDLFSHVTWENHMGVTWDGHTTEEKYERLAELGQNYTGDTAEDTAG